MNVFLHIEQLVVDEAVLGRGGRVGQEALQAAVIAELTRLVGEGGLRSDWLAGGSVPQVLGGVMAFVPGQMHEPDAWGAQIGQAVYAGLGDLTRSTQK